MFNNDVTKRTLHTQRMYNKAINYPINIARK